MSGAFSAAALGEQERCLQDIAHHQAANRSYMAEGVQLLELARNAGRLFAHQDSQEKRRLLNLLVSNCSWAGGELIATFREPFDLLAKTVAADRRRKAASSPSDSISENWLR